jgi:small subunit ribosomal protein S6
MRRYETFSILDPDLSAEGRTPVIDKVKEVIIGHDGFLVQVDNWGNRKLAYEIKKKARGYYVRFDFCGDATLVNEMERFFRINDSVMKFMTVLLDKEIDLEKVKEEAAALEAERSRSKETAKETPSESKTPDLAESEAKKDQAETADATNPEAKKGQAETADATDSEAKKDQAETADATGPEAKKDQAETADATDPEVKKDQAETADATDPEVKKADAEPTPEESQEQTPEETDEEKK